jgi:hypothetical protein
MSRDQRCCDPHEGERQFGDREMSRIPSRPAPASGGWAGSEGPKRSSSRAYSRCFRVDNLLRAVGLQVLPLLNEFRRKGTGPHSGEVILRDPPAALAILQPDRLFDSGTRRYRLANRDDGRVTRSLRGSASFPRSGPASGHGHAAAAARARLANCARRRLQAEKSASKPLRGTGRRFGSYSSSSERSLQQRRHALYRKRRRVAPAGSKVYHQHADGLTSVARRTSGTGPLRPPRWYHFDEGASGRSLRRAKVDQEYGTVLSEQDIPGIEVLCTTARERIKRCDASQTRMRCPPPGPVHPRPALIHARGEGPPRTYSPRKSARSPSSAHVIGSGNAPSCSLKSNSHARRNRGYSSAGAVSSTYPRPPSPPASSNNAGPPRRQGRIRPEESGSAPETVIRHRRAESSKNATLPKRPVNLYGRH